MRSVKTADLCDLYPTELEVAIPLLRSYGGIKTFSGQIATVQVVNDNVLVRQALEEQGNGRVLVVDGGGSLECALVGDQLAEIGARNGWAGIVIYGCIRDSEAIANVPIGVKALNTTPRKSGKLGTGKRDVPVTFAGITFTPGHYLYADEDGIVVSKRDLSQA